MTTGDEKAADLSPDSYLSRLTDLAQMQRRLREISASASAPRKVVSVTVGNNGELTDLSFPTNAYKTMPRTELAAIILRTVAEARSKAMRQSAEVFAPMLPAGLNMDDLVEGNVGLTDLMPEGIPLPPDLADFPDGRPGGSGPR